MITKIEAYGFVDEDGSLKLSNKKRFKQDLLLFKNKDVEVTIKKRGKRSLQQNKYYFGIVVYEIRRRLYELGNEFDGETVHEFLKQKFNKEKVEIKTTGELLEVGQTTTQMNKDQFSEYIERIRRWASETLEIDIPDANTQTELFAA